MNIKSAIIIPARLEATRFPKKLLHDLNGKPVLKWVYDALKKHEEVGRLIIATDSELIKNEADKWGAEVVISKENHLNGTSRCTEVAKALMGYDIVVNVQGDEPFIKYHEVKSLINYLSKPKAHKIASLVKTVNKDHQDLQDHARVKVVLNKYDKALYFSRSKIPFEQNVKTEIDFFIHVGIYGFRRNTLLELASLEPCELELKESLEQLRWLYHGYEIQMLKTEMNSLSIDTPKDLEKAKAYLDQ